MLRSPRPAGVTSADDDGSGTVGVLEIAETLAKGRERPTRSILFVWHTAEEKGLVGSRRLSTELGDLVEAVNREDAHGFTFDYRYDAPGHRQNVYCRSDHANYARYGIPIVFFTTGSHEDYHQVTDEPQYIDYDKLTHVAQLIADVALHVADLDHRVVVDKPKPDPNAPCKQ